MRRVLLFSSRFFPHPSVGAVRVTQWCRFLPQHGWEPFVMCRDYGLALTDAQLASAVHPLARVRFFSGRWGSKTPNRFFDTIARRTTLYPVDQSDVAGVVAAVRPDAVLTSGPPHSIHQLGLRITRDTGIPWVADFRDPYLFDPQYRPHGLLRPMELLDRRLERAVYDHAAAILHAIPSHARDSSERYPEARARIHTLLNGCPPELMDGSIVPERSSGARQSIRLIGRSGRTPRERLARAVAQLVALGRDVELRIVGERPDDAEVLEGILKDRLVLTGAKSHPDALRETVGADVLVAALGLKRSPVRLSSKLFEYVGAAKPVIVINPTAADTEVFERAPGVVLLRQPDIEEITRALERALSAGHSLVTAQREFIEANFRRDRQTGALAAILDAVTAESSRRPHR